MAEDELARAVLIRTTSGIEGPAASGPRRRATTRPPAVPRKKALEALRKRPAAEYRQVLLDGFRYPWPAVADHAAEAIVALNSRETAPTLRTLVERPDPTVPFEKPGKGK